MADSYEIVAINPRIRSVAGSQFVHVQEVTFATKPNGLGGTVDIPDETFTPDQVDAIVSVAAANLEAVKAL